MFVLTIGLPDLHQQLIGLKAHAAWHSLEVDVATSCFEADASWRVRKPDACFVRMRGDDIRHIEQFICNLRACWDATAIYVVLDEHDGEVEPLEQLFMAAGATDCIRSCELGRPMQEHCLRRAVRDRERMRAHLERDHFFELMEQDMGVGLWQWDPRNDFYRWSDQEYRLFDLEGVAPEDVSYTRWRDAIHPDDQERVEAEIGRAIVGVSAYNSVFRMGTPGADGLPRWLAGVARLRRDRSGAPSCLYGVNWDVSACRNVQSEAMRRLGCTDCLSHLMPNIFQQYFKLAADCLFHVKEDAGGVLRYTAINPAGCAHAGKTVQEIVGKTPVEVLGAEVGGIIDTGLRQALHSGKPFSYKHSFDMGGASVTFDAVYIPIADEWGRHSGVLGCARDITAYECLQTTLFQAQKMEVLGQFSSGVAHDFNNILQNVSNLIELFGYAREPDQTTSLLKRGRAVIACGQALTSRLLAFARKTEPLAKVLDPNVLIENVREILQLSVGGGIEIRTALQAGVWPVKADPGQLDLMLINLAVNARDAMGGTGTLTIATQNVALCDDAGGILPAGDYVCISVSDTGSGMSADVLARAAQPFFTTKPVGQGTGLGLSMVRTYLRDMAGDCKIVSVPGQGTCVSMYLPRAG
ncbi:ATP-binding protein [Massilia consociata]|uniref:histidine kinase n=2 Tax=Massilia consociata TaxID=760117 RepID=A0ABV6FKZ5_9BURK